MAHHVMDLPESWSLHRDDEARPSLVHKDGRRLEPAQAVDLECAERLYVDLKLEHDKRQREFDGVERTADAMAIWSAYAVIGYFRRTKRKAQGPLKEEQKKKEPFEVSDEGVVYDLKGNPVGLTAPPLEEDESPEAFLDQELDALTKAQQLSRARLWQKVN